MAIVLLLIPILCVSLSIFIMNLINFITLNELDILLFCGTTFVYILTSFFVLRQIIKTNEQSAFFMNLDRDFLEVYGYLSYLPLFIASIFFIIDSCLNELNLIYLISGIVICIFFLYITFQYFIRKEVKELKITNVSEYNKYVNLIYLTDEINTYEFYISNKIKLKEDSMYRCVLSKKTKKLKRIKEEIK